MPNKINRKCEKCLQVYCSESSILWASQSHRFEKSQHSWTNEFRMKINITLNWHLYTLVHDHTQHRPTDNGYRRMRIFKVQRMHAHAQACVKFAGISNISTYFDIVFVFALPFVDVGHDNWFFHHLLRLVRQFFYSVQKQDQ